VKKRTLFPAMAMMLLAGVTCLWTLPLFSEETATGNNVGGIQLAEGETDEGGISLAELSESFRGKILMLEIDRSSALESRSGHAVLKEARILLIGDRYFLHGTGHAPAEYKQSWYNDTFVGISWESVSRYYVMTYEQFEEYTKQYSKKNQGTSNQDYE